MRCLGDEVVFRRTLEEAIAQGINHLETAQGYGKSEIYLGQALEVGLPVPRKKLVVTTKLPPTPDAATMRLGIEKSLQRLQVEYIDCLAIHGINTWEHLSWIENPQGCMQAVTEAVADGYIKHVGFSTHAPLEVILATINTGLFAFVNLHYYYFFTRHRAAIDLAAQQDMGIFIISPADKGGRLYTPPKKLSQLCQPLSPLALNYRFLLSDSRITTLSVGAANPEELSAPLQLADRDDSLNATEKAILARLSAQLTQSLGTEQCHQCYQCLPCPEAINIPEVLRLRNVSLAYDMTEFGQYRYRMFGNAGHWFPGTPGNRCTDCGECLPRCPQQLDIPNLLRDTHQRLQGSPRRRLWQS